MSRLPRSNELNINFWNVLAVRARPNSVAECAEIFIKIAKKVAFALLNLLRTSVDIDCVFASLSQKFTTMLLQMTDHISPLQRSARQVKFLFDYVMASYILLRELPICFQHHFDGFGEIFPCLFECPSLGICAR